VVEVPNTEEQERLAKRLAGAGLAVTQQGGNVSVRDPWNNEVVLAVRRKAEDSRPPHHRAATMPSAGVRRG
jgi:hypothetical protein